MHKSNLSNIYPSKIRPEREKIRKKILPPITAGLINNTTSNPLGNLYKVLIGANTIDVFLAEVKKLLARIEIEDYALSRLSGSGKVENLITTLPLEISKIYQHNLILGNALSTKVPVFFSQIAAHAANLPNNSHMVDRNNEILSLIVNFCIYDFCIIPLGEYNENGRVILTVATKDEKHLLYKYQSENGSGPLIQLTETINYLGTRYFPNFFLFRNEKQKVHITPQQLVILNLMFSDDLNLLQVADKLGLSRHTVDKHIGNARKALGTKTIHCAVYRAIELGLIIPNLNSVLDFMNDGKKTSLS